MVATGRLKSWGTWIRNPSSVLGLSHGPYVFRCRRAPPLCARAIIYSFVITSGISVRSVHAPGRQTFRIIHVWWCYSSFPRHLCQNIDDSRKVWARTSPYVPPFRPIDQAAAEHSRLMLTQSLTYSWSAIKATALSSDTFALLLMGGKSGSGIAWGLPAARWYMKKGGRKEEERREQCFIWASYWIILKLFILRAGFPVWHY